MKARVTIVPPTLGPGAVAAARLDGVLAARPFPDLSDHLVLLPAMQDAAVIRDALLATRVAAIGPVFATLRTLAAPREAARKVGLQSARLYLYALLQRHRGLYGEGDPWQLAEAVLHLFQEFEREGVEPGTDPGNLARRLADGYGLAATSEPLGREARLVTTLWSAWQDEPGAALGVESTALHALGMMRRSTDMRLIIAGCDEMPGPLADEVTAWLEAGRAEVYWTGPRDGLPAEWERWVDEFENGCDDPRAAMVKAALGSHEASALAARARVLGTLPRPRAASWAVWTAPDAEREAQAVVIQVRRWWLEGHRRIAIVTDDRRLARRIRALLGRAGIQPADPGGWALSTTSAAAALERWLETVEADFRASPLLDLLKSPFFPRREVGEDLLESVWRFEEGVVRHENISRGLDAFRRALDRRRKRLPDGWQEPTFERIHALLDHVDAAARPLSGAGGPRTRQAVEWLERLDQSLDRLGMRALLTADPAGECILEALAAMRQAAKSRPVVLDWHGFRTWLGRSLELETFRSEGDPSVMLLQVAAAANGSWDAMILCGCDAQHLPGPRPRSPFFNDGVRRELGLSTWQADRALRQVRFARALLAAPRTVVTHPRERGGDTVMPSPWLELLVTTHRLAWGQLPDDAALTDRVSAVAAMKVDDRTGWPAQPARPAPSAPNDLPARWSVAAHQQLIDCPYRFFAAQCLGLQAPEEIREYLAAVDFGNLVHRCLHAFLVGVDGLPGPFAGELTPARRPEAMALLQRTGEQVFADGLEANYAHQGWYRVWQAAIPALVDWEIERAGAGWRPGQAEHRIERAVGSVILHGRCDRIDRRGDEVAVIDYKTGTPPGTTQIERGENVQLSSYGLLLDDVTELRFVQVSDPGEGKSLNSPGVDEAVPTLLAEVSGRLEHCADALQQGASMPAWGDATTCGYCQYSGVCRRASWEHPDDRG